MLSEEELRLADSDCPACDLMVPGEGCTCTGRPTYNALVAEVRRLRVELQSTADDRTNIHNKLGTCANQRDSLRAEVDNWRETANGLGESHVKLEAEVERLRAELSAERHRHETQMIDISKLLSGMRDPMENGHRYYCQEIGGVRQLLLQLAEARQLLEECVYSRCEADASVQDEIAAFLERTK